jgi:hypothetical protein
MRDHRKVHAIIIFFFSLITIKTLAQEEEDPLKEDQELTRTTQDNTLVFNPNNLRDSTCDPCGTLDQFFTLEINEAIQKNIYIRSNSVLDRSVLDLPIFQLRAKCQAGPYNFSAFPFYNQTGKMFFSRTSSSLDSYIDFGQEGFIGTIIKIIQEKAKQANFQIEDINEILPLFTKIKLQERRAGGCFTFDFLKDCWSFRAAMPLYYLERNFFLTNAEIDAISQAPYIRDLSAGANDVSVRNLLMRHLVSDKITFLGDVRLQALYEAPLNECVTLRLGGLVTLPTAFPLKKGIMGGPFCKSKKFNTVDTERIMFLACKLITQLVDTGSANPVDKEQLKDILNDLAFNVLDSLSAKVVEMPLSNGFNLGPIFEFEYNFDNRLQFLSQFFVKGFLPRKEVRFFIDKLNPNDFINSVPPDCTPEKARAIYAFYSQVLTDSLYLSPFKVKVYPGIIFQNTSLLRYTVGCANLFFGYDFWWQAKERIKFYEEKPKQPILFRQALNPSIMQQKIFGGFSVSTPYCSGELSLGLRGDLTVFSKGIGKDFSLAFELGYSF